MRRFAIGIAIGGVCAVCAGCGESTPPAAPAAPAPVSQEFSEAFGNRAPVIESVRLDPAEPAHGAVLHAVVTARDPEGQPVTLAHRWFVDGAEQRTTDAAFPLEAVAKGSKVRVSVTASDGALVSDVVEASTRVIDRPPEITATWLAPEKSVTPGQPVTASAGGADPDGDALEFEYTWYVNGERRSDSGSLFKTDGLKGGDAIYAEVRASDGSNWTEFKRTPVVTVGSGHPEITSTPPGFREDGDFRYQVVAVDPDGDKRLRFKLEKGPDGMVIDNVLGSLSWHPSHAEPGVYPVVVVVRDSSGLETKQLFSVTVEEKTETVATPVGRHIRVRKPAEGTPASPE